MIRSSLPPLSRQGVKSAWWLLSDRACCRGSQYNYIPTTIYSCTTGKTFSGVPGNTPLCQGWRNSTQDIVVNDQKESKCAFHIAACQKSAPKATKCVEFPANSLKYKGQWERFLPSELLSCVHGPDCIGWRWPKRRWRNHHTDTSERAARRAAPRNHHTCTSERAARRAAPRNHHTDTSERAARKPSLRNTTCSNTQEHRQKILACLSLTIPHPWHASCHRTFCSHSGNNQGRPPEWLNDFHMSTSGDIDTYSELDNDMMLKELLENDTSLSASVDEQPEQDIELEHMKENTQKQKKPKKRTRKVKSYSDSDSPGDSETHNEQGDGVFQNMMVSYPSVTHEEIKKYLDDHQVCYREGYTCLSMTCPRISTRSKVASTDNIKKLLVNFTSGFYVCQHCKKFGNWMDLQDTIGTLSQYKRLKKGKPKVCEAGVSLESFQEKAQRDAAALWAASPPPKDLEPDILEYILDNLAAQELTIETLEAFGVRVLPEQNGLVLPTFNFDQSLSGVKVMSFQFIEDSTERSKVKISTKSIPRVNNPGLFGWSSTRGKHVVITASELDAMAVRQKLKLAAVSLPQGARTLPQQLLPTLEECSRVTLWLGGDMNTWAQAKQFARKLNTARTYLVRPDADNPAPLLSLRHGRDLHNIVRSARSIDNRSIVTFHQLRQDVRAEIEQTETLSGIKWKRYQQLNRLLKGHRRGELTVFTGPTGSGKTTFMSEYSLDLCMQGVNTLWGSFEINNVRLLRTMLTQYAQRNLSKHRKEFDHHANQFEQLPLYFMTFHGQQRMTEVLETMMHAIYVHDISHVVVDNLQFMMGESGSKPVDKFQKQDHIIGQFRQFATQNNCHVTLVIHPRKEKESEDLTISSIFGSAKATQEADNVLILQDKRLTSLRGKKYIQIAKNRFDGELGMMVLKFNKESKSYTVPEKSQKTKPENMESLESAATPLGDVEDTLGNFYQ